MGRINKIQVNLDKFQVFDVVEKTYEKKTPVQIQNANITCEATVKLFEYRIPIKC